MRLLWKWTLMGLLLGAMALLVCAPLAASTDDEEINRLARECEAGIEKACKKLAEIAKKDKDPAVCLAAVQKLTYQGLLQDIAKSSRHFDVRMAAYDRLDDRSTRRGTVHYLTDQAMLAEIAKNTGEDSEVRQDAIRKLANQSLILDLARNEKNEYVRKAAVERLPAGHPLRQVVLATEAEVQSLADQTILADIAENAHDYDARKAAAEKLSDQDPRPLAKLAKNESEDVSIRLIAIKKLNDQTLLAEIVLSDTHNEVRVAAVKKLKDQSLLAKLAMSDEGYEVWTAALEQLADQPRLTDIAMNAQNLETRKQAADKITDQILLADIAKNADNPRIREKAVAKITDQILLADIFKKDADQWVQIRALRRLSSQEMLTSISRDRQQPLNIRLEAVTILSDSENFKIGRTQIVQALLEIRQEALRQKNRDLYKTILGKLTPDDLVEMRKRAPRATIQGRLIKRENGEALASIPLFLGEMKSGRECMLYSDLITTTDDKGNFVLKNVPNGFYTVVYSRSEKPMIPPSAVLLLDSREFNASMQSGSFSGGRLMEGTSTISSMQIGIDLSFEVRNSDVVEFGVLGTGIRELVFEVY